MFTAMFYHIKHYAKISTVLSKTHYALQKVADRTAQCDHKLLKSLQIGRSVDRVPVAARFFAPVQTGPGIRPAFCTMGTGFFSGGK
jgi:hypothetical protein